MAAFSSIVIPILILICWIELVISNNMYTNKWAVKIKGGARTARSIVELHGFTFRGKIVGDYYNVEHQRVRKRSLSMSKHHSTLLLNPMVEWAEQQQAKTRVKRDLINFNDPKYEAQWYLQNNVAEEGENVGMNIHEAWNLGITGKNVVVTILDDGIEWTHPDLRQNYDGKASIDINDGDSDPIPRYDFTNENRHGTRCAGEIAAVANNSLCGVGIAYKSKVGGIRMLDGDVTDSVEATSLSFNRAYIDIYSASWGPEDDGRTVDGPNLLAREAFREGVERGRNGKGSIFVWASGNGGRDHDNCNCDGYTASIYTLSVSSATEKGSVPWYSERCSSTLVSTYSSGDNNERKIATTDLRHGCTSTHTGTSASAPLAAGIVALALEANPSLTWRDVQYISVLAANPNGLSADDWTTNGAGLNVSHNFGFGLMDAGAMVKLASNWTRLPRKRICEAASPNQNLMIASNKKIVLKLKTSGCFGTDKEVKYLEHVQAKISISSKRRGALQIWLISPSGTRSTLLTSRSNDNSVNGFNEWPFLTTHHWGEEATGEWTLEISNDYRAIEPAMLLKWSLVLHGTEINPVNREITTTSTSTTTTEIHSTDSLKDTMAKAGILLLPHLQSYEERTTPLTLETSPASLPTTTTMIEENNLIYNIIPANPVLPMVSTTTQLSNSISQGSSDKLRCQSGLYLMREHCLRECPDGWYPTAVYSRLECLPCHYTCATCVQQYNNSCTECYYGSKLIKGRCVHNGYREYKTAASVRETNGRLESIVVGATSALAVLVLVLISLLVYYIVRQRQAQRFHPGSQFTGSTTISQSSDNVSNKEDTANSQSSSQLELIHDHSDQCSTETSQLDSELASPSDPLMAMLPLTTYQPSSLTAASDRSFYAV